MKTTKRYISNRHSKIVGCPVVYLKSINSVKENVCEATKKKRVGFLRNCIFAKSLLYGIPGYTNKL